MKPRLTATSVIRSPRYYGHFFWLIGDRINGVPLYNRIQVTRVDVIGVCILALRRLVRMDTTELAHLLFAWIISDGGNSHQKTSPWNSDNNWTELDSLQTFLLHKSSFGLLLLQNRGCNLKGAYLLSELTTSRCSYQEDSSINLYYSARSVYSYGLCREMMVLVEIWRKDYSFIFKMTGQAGQLWNLISALTL